MNKKKDYELVFLFPHLLLNDGGHLAQQKFYELAAEFHSCRVITYQHRHNNVNFLDDWLKHHEDPDDKTIYCLHYGPHISKLCRRLKGKRIIYFAHSTGWKIKLPVAVPVINVSKHSLAYWGKYAPHNPLFYLPNLVADSFALPNNSTASNTFEPATHRPYDIIVVTRKMSTYLLHKIIPKLQQKYTVRLIDSWVDDLSREFQCSKVFLYDSACYWSKQGVSEGFGLPPLEAMACGCTVFSSLNDALADYLDPATNCYQLGISDVQYDIQRISRAVKNWQEPTVKTDIARHYRKTAVQKRMAFILNEISNYFMSVF